MSLTRRLSPGQLDAAAVGLPLAGLYLATLSKDLGAVDSGELAVVAARLGIAHPTGYPLYTLLARLAVLLIPGSPIAAVNLLSAACAVVAAVVTSGLARELLGQRPARGPTVAGAAVAAGLDGRDRLRRQILPWTAGLLLGTSSVFWSQATGNEVYALHLLLTALALRQSVVLLRPESGPRDLLLLAWIGGLALAHHLSVIFLAPAILVCVGQYLRQRARLFAGERDRRGSRLAVAFAAAVFAGLLAWSVVLYLPIRAAGGPLLAWGAPDSWGRFWRHVLGHQYRVWMFESAGRWVSQIGGYFESLPGRFSWPALALAVLGTSVAAAGKARFGCGRPGARWVLPLVLAVTVLWASSYDIHDLEPYFLPADLALAVLASAGLAWLAERLGAGPRGGSRTVFALSACLALGLVLVQVVFHFGPADRRADRFIRFHAGAVLQGLPERAVLLSRFWDATVSPALYLQEVEGMRRDIAVVDVELLRRSWYYPQLARWDSSLLEPLRGEVATFLERVADFEARRAYDPARIETSYRAVIAAIATRHRPGRPTACTADAEPDLRASGVLVPEGLAYVIRDGPQDAVAMDPPDVNGLLRSGYRPRDPIHRRVILAWAQAISARILFLERMGRSAEIAPWREAMARIQPAAEEARARSR